MSEELQQMVGEIVSAYVSNNSVPVSELPALITSVHSSLRSIATGAVPAPAEKAAEPAVPIKKSVTKDFIICLEDGKKFKSLRRHLASAYGMTPEAYRAKWGLAADYPMVAPAYSAQRSSLAKAIGLGRPGKTTAQPTAAAKPKKAA